MNLPSFQTHTTVVWPSLCSRLCENVNVFVFLLSPTTISCVYSYFPALLPLQTESSSCNLLLRNAVGFLQHEKSQLQKITLQKRINLILALCLSVQAEAPYRKNLHPDRALTDKYTVYYNMQITILDECSVLILYFHTLNFTITFSTFFHCLSHHFVYFSLLTQVRICWNKIYIVIVNYGSYGLIIL